MIYLEKSLYYINKNSNDSYIQLTNGNVEVSEPTGGGATRVFKNEQVKLYINYLNIDENKVNNINKTDNTING